MNDLSKLSMNIVTDYAKAVRNDPVHDFHVVDHPSKPGKFILYPDSTAAMRWLWDKMPEYLNRYDTSGYVLTSLEMRMITKSMSRDNLMSEDDVNDALEEQYHYQALQALEDEQ